MPRSTLGVSELGEHHSEVRVSERVARRYSDCTLQVMLCVRQVALLIENDAKVVVYFGVLRVHAKGAFKMLLCSSEFMLVRQQDAEKDMTRQHVWRKRQGLLVMNSGFAKASHFLKFTAHLVMRHRRIRKGFDY